MAQAHFGRFKATPIFRESRRRGLSRLTIVIAGGSPQEILVRDFSSRGFSAAAQGEPPPADAIVTALMPDGRALWGIVRWRERNLFGVEFDVNSPPADAATGSDLAIRT